MQSYVEIGSAETLANSLSEILNNDKSIMSCHSGTAFPTVNLQVGMLCFRTDVNQLYQLKNATPTWILLLDLSGAGSVVATATNATQLNGQAAAFYQTALGFTPAQQGGGTSQLTNKLYMGWSAASKLRVQVDTTDFGTLWPIDTSGNSATSTTASNSLSLDGYVAAAYPRLAATNAYTAQQNYTGNQATVMATATASLGAVVVQGDGTNAAFMTFLRPSAYGAYFGIDTDNKWKVGGWSAGAVAYSLFHEGNLPTFAQVASKPTTVAGYGITDVAASGSQTFTASGNFTAPAGVYKVWITGVAGGGYSGANSTSTGGAGGSGARAFRTPVAVTPGSVYAVTVGAASGASSFGALLTLQMGGNGGAASGGTPGVNGAQGTPCYISEASFTAIDTVGPSTPVAGSGNGAARGSNGAAGTSGLMIVEW